MPRRTDEHRDIAIEVSEEAVEEALAQWITAHHGIEVDRKAIEVIKGNDGKISAKITKRAAKEPTDSGPDRDASGQDSG